MWRALAIVTVVEVALTHYVVTLSTLDILLETRLGYRESQSSELYTESA